MGKKKRETNLFSFRLKGDPDDPFRILSQFQFNNKEKIFNSKWSYIENIDHFWEKINGSKIKVNIYDFDAILNDQLYGYYEIFDETSDQSFWDDNLFLKERRIFAQKIIEFAKKSSLITIFRNGSGEKLDHATRVITNRTQFCCDYDDENTYIGSEQVYRFLAPSLRRASKHLIDNKIIRKHDLNIIAQNTEKRDQSIAEIFVESLTPQQRMLLEIISIVRCGIDQISVNKDLAELILGPVESIPETLSQLKSLGAIINQDHEVIVPRLIRQYCRLLLESREPEKFKYLNNKIVDELEHLDVNSDLQLDGSFHARLASNIEKIWHFSSFEYSNAKLLAYQLSIDNKFEESAYIYNKIIKEINQSDAYCWEYYAYNLARSSTAPAKAPLIQEAYKRAVELEPSNPLYNGRYFGNLILNNIDIIDTFKSSLNFYSKYENRHKLTWFLEPITRSCTKVNTPQAIQILTIIHSEYMHLARIAEILQSWEPEQ